MKLVGVTGILKETQVWDFNSELHLPHELRVGKCVQVNGSHRNMWTNGGLREWMNRPFTALFPVCIAGEGTDRDTRYPEFTNTPSTDIGARSGNSVKLTGITDTTICKAYDVLVYEDPALGRYTILSRVVSGSDLQLIVANYDGTAATGTTPANSPFWIFRVTENTVEGEVARAGTPAGSGQSSAAQSDGTGFIPGSGSTTGPFIQGSGATAHVTSLSGGASTGFTVDTGGINYPDYARPDVVADGGGAGQFIPATVTTILGDAGQIKNQGTSYSNTPGDVTCVVLGAGRPITFPCAVSGGLLTGIDISAGVGHFSDLYTTEGVNPTLEIVDVSGTGSGAVVELYPRRAPEGEAIVAGGAVIAIRQTYAGYKLTSDPITVTLYPTAYFVDEQTNVFAVEISTRHYSKLGFSHTIIPGDNANSSLVIRNQSTGAIAAVTVLTGQQLRATYQTIRTFSMVVPTTIPSDKIGQWNANSSIAQRELFGISGIDGNCRRICLDLGWLLNEPNIENNGAAVYALTGATIGDALMRSQVYIGLTDSTASHLPFGQMVTRDGGIWDAKPVGTPTIKYFNDDEDAYPVSVTAEAFFSVISTPLSNVGSVCRCLLRNTTPKPSIGAIGLSVVHTTAAMSQTVNQGKPNKPSTKTFRGAFVDFIDRTFSVN